MASSRSFASRLALFALTSISLAGCYASHVAPGDPRACGTSICEDGEQCCRDCDGGGRCVPLDLPCPDIVCTEDCRSNAECADDEYCRVERDVCGGPGRCEPRPRSCTADCPGVCGCDFTFYCNECVAASAGVNVQERAACEGEVCGREICGSGTTCCPLCGGESVCVPADEMCPFVECPGECFSPFDCGFEQVCQFPFGTCGGPGRCVPFPSGCEDDCPGVCGCDGVVYCNDCVALLDGASVTEPELCGLLPCGRRGEVCLSVEYCDLGADCGASDDQRCLMRPSVCTDELDPVCGCDGLTYENACSAQAAGVTVRFRGACEG